MEIPANDPVYPIRLGLGADRAGIYEHPGNRDDGADVGDCEPWLSVPQAPPGKDIPEWCRPPGTQRPLPWCLRIRYIRIFRHIQLSHWFMDIQKKYDLIIGNPPFSLALEFIQRAFQVVKPGGKVIFLLRTAFLESDRRFSFWQEPGHMPTGHPDSCSLSGAKTVGSCPHHLPALYYWVSFLPLSHWLSYPVLSCHTR